MKKSFLKQTSLLLCFGAGIFCAVITPAWGQLSQVQPWVPPKKEIKVPEDYRTFMVEAMQIHAIQYQINNMEMTSHPNTVLAEKYVTVKQAQFDALNACNVERLASVYQNPEEAWKNMTNEYERQERELKVYINAANPMEKEDPADLAFPQWRIGRDVLTDVYANPEKYGKLLGSDEQAGFKHWKDQDYIYVEKVNHFLEDVVSALGVANIPGISRNNSYTQNAAAYTAFLNGVKSSQPNKYAALPADMLVFPQPPAPLPPANEIIKLTEDSSNGVLFPKMPEPWAEYIKNPRIQRLPEGEMSEYYQPNTLKLRVEVGNKKLDNRFAVYQAQRDELAVRQEMLRIHQNADKNAIENINSSLKDLNISMELQPDDMSTVKTELINRKKKAIDKARDLLAQKAAYQTQNMSAGLNQFRALSLSDKLKALNEIDRNSDEYGQALALLNASQGTQDEAFLDAMEKDIDGITMVSTVNAKDIEQLMKSAEAQAALVQTVYTKEEDNIEKQKAQKIDADCLNGGL